MTSVGEVLFTQTVTLADGSTLEITGTRHAAAPPVPPPTPAPPPPPVPADVKTCIIGAASYPVAAVNPTPKTFPAGYQDPSWAGRPPGALIVLKAPVQATTTNRWGAEATVDAAGRVTAIHDRATGTDPGPTPVPVDGCVLSGHDEPGGPQARSWLLAHATPPSGDTPGALVTWSATPVPPPEPTPGPAPAPPPGPSPAPAPTTGIRALWHWGWGSADPTAYPSDVTGAVNLVHLAMAQSAESGTGRLTTPPGITKAQVDALTSRGVDVFAAVGGSGNGGITITTPATVADALASLTGMRKSLGITGVTFDLEDDPGTSWTPAAVISLAKRAVAAGLKVAIWSALYGGRLQAWGQVAQALGPDLHVWERGFYDFPQATSAELAGIVAGDLQSMRPYVTSDRQLAACFAPTDPGDAATSPPSVIRAAYASARGACAGVGWSVWHDANDAAHGWAGSRALLGS